jgi:hypothetical protein
MEDMEVIFYLKKRERERVQKCVRTTNEGKSRKKHFVQTDKKREIFCAQREKEISKLLFIH